MISSFNSDKKTNFYNTDKPIFKFYKFKEVEEEMGKKSGKKFVDEIFKRDNEKKEK